MANILVRYQYVSASNDKNEESPAIFSNPTGVSRYTAEEAIRTYALEGAWFVPQDVELPAVFFGSYVDGVDGPLHEILTVEETDLAPNARPIQGFIAGLARGARKGWDEITDQWHQWNLEERE